MSKLWALCAFLLLFTTACSDSDGTGPRIPEVSVDEQISVNSQLYPGLRQDNGYAYINGGYNGILIVRQNAGQYLAFERACPYEANTTCQVEVDPSNLFIVDDCCGSQFNLQGNVTGGPAVYGLRQYQTALSGSLLYISN